MKKDMETGVYQSISAISMLIECSFQLNQADLPVAVDYETDNLCTESPFLDSFYRFYHMLYLAGMVNWISGAVIVPDNGDNFRAVPVNRYVYPELY